MLLQGYLIYYNWSQFGCITLVRTGKNVRIMLPSRTFSPFKKFTPELYLIQVHVQ